MAAAAIVYIYLRSQIARIISTHVPSQTELLYDFRGLIKEVVVLLNFGNCIHENGSG